MFSTVSRPKPHGTPGAQRDLLDAARGLLADVVVVARLAADDGAEARDAVVAAGLGGHERRERQLERAGHVEDVDAPPRRPLGRARSRP